MVRVITEDDLKAMGIPLPEGMDEIRAKKAQQAAWWNAHYHDLLEQYSDQFVAVRDGQVVASRSDLFEMMDELERLCLRGHEDVSMKYITTKWSSLKL